MTTVQDAIVIGAGQSGPFLAAKLASAGQKVTLVERRGLGGTCVNDGCTPTKTLVASARAAHAAREGARLGVVARDVRVDWAVVQRRMRAVVQSSVDSLTSWLTSLPTLSLVFGEARFVSPNAVEVNGERIEAKRIFINTGASAVVPDALRGVALTHTSLLQIERLPEHLAIFGSSYIALEFAQIFRRFGSRVTVFERGPRILSREDERVSTIVAQVLAREGVDIVTNASATAERTIGASHVLAATGRAPNTKALALDQAGVAIDAHGFITVDDKCVTNVPHIYALGDVNGRGAFTHTSYNDYEIVAANLLDGGDRSISERAFVASMFIDPPLARLGMSESQARASGRAILKGERDMTRVSRARERGETDGFMQILVDASTKKIVGATILGIEGDEAISVVAAVMHAGADYTSLQRTVLPHPTVSELLPTILGEMKPL